MGQRFLITLPLLIILLFSFINVSSASHDGGLENELYFIHREIGLLREENQHQNQEITFLKEKMGSQNNQMDQKPDRRKKRPVRLLPPHVYHGKAKNDSNNYQPPIQFYGPPTNCSDLYQLGYTLNGFYLVSTNNSDALQTDTIYCAFKQPNFNPKAVEKRVTRSSSRVHFYVRKATNVQKINRNNDTIIFDRIYLNMGGGFNETTGIFTAPKSGIYNFVFNGMVKCKNSDQDTPFHVILSVNANFKPRYDATFWDNQLLDRILQATIKLNRGDNINLHMVSMTGSPIELYGSSTFSGSLLEVIDS